MNEENKNPIFGPERVVDTDFRDSRKLHYDFFKHLTTLSTGSILLLVTFLEKIFQNPQWPRLIIWVICTFILVTLGSLLSMLLSTVIIENSGKHKKSVGTLADISGFLNLTFFVTALILLAIFVGKNFS